ncbi:hypothetical protein [Bradyrhizobium sp. RT3a]|uniref:hypothetical protein n=1 Tax=unclassified Bradyrhizobium TaxID=2631580 RepID=UPI003394AD24
MILYTLKLRMVFVRVFLMKCLPMMISAAAAKTLANIELDDLDAAVDRVIAMCAGDARKAIAELKPHAPRARATARQIFYRLPARSPRHER